MSIEANDPMSLEVCIPKIYAMYYMYTMPFQPLDLILLNPVCYLEMISVLGICKAGGYLYVFAILL
jgi:hypothetical protein